MLNPLVVAGLVILTGLVSIPILIRSLLSAVQDYNYEMSFREDSVDGYDDLAELEEDGPDRRNSGSSDLSNHRGGGGVLQHCITCGRWKGETDVPEKCGRCAGIG